MTPTEVTDILRQLNAWRRCDKNIRLPDPREIGEAIDEAIEMIERLEATEEDRSNFLVEIGKLCAQCDALRAKIEQMEKREPARLVTPTAYRWRRRGSVMWQYGELTEETAQAAKEHNHEVQPLYAIPGAKGEEE